jgi:plasmid replication initiation protein
MDDEYVVEPEDGSVLSPIRIGRDEMNLAEFPFAVLSKIAPRNANTLEFDDVVTMADGTRVERRWMVTGSERFGLPTATDEEVYVALMEVTKEHGFTSRTVPITRYDLITRMGWRPDGRSYSRLEGSLDRLKGVTIKAVNAFWDNQARRYITVAFGIIDNYVLFDERQARGIGERERRQSYITWNDVIFNSFLAGNIKLLDTDLYFSLRSPIARRLYRYLDKKRYPDKRSFQITLEKLAYEHLGMTRGYFPSQLRRKLTPAHRELIARGFLEAVEYGFTQTGAEKAVYYFAKRQEQARPPLPPEGAAALNALVENGVTIKTAIDLIQIHSISDIWAQLAYLPYRSARNPGAVLVQSIRESWAAPAAYLEHERERQRAEQAGKAAAEQAVRENQERSQRALYKNVVQQILAELEDWEREAVEREVDEALDANFAYLRGHQGHPVYQAVRNEEMVKAVARRYPEQFRALLAGIQKGAECSSGPT